MINQEENETLVSVMEIERFAIHDGPGIRTVVFMQGCPLHCLWCSNPESQQLKINLMHLATRCVGCGNCVSVCRENAIRLINGKAVFDRSACVLCKSCASVCLHDAIRFVGERKTVTEIIQLVLKDKEYYAHSGGGVTFSGGEAFVQFDALMCMLRACKKEKLHTTVETCGQVSLSKIKEAFDWIDLFLFDLKHIDEAILKSSTGADLSLVLGNLAFIAKMDASKVVLRVPVIPNLNFSKEVLKNIFDLALQYGISKVHLLPYHTLGVDKYAQLDRIYSFSNTFMMKKEMLIPYKVLGEQLGLDVQIGG